MQDNSGKVASGLFWKMFERFGVLGTQFVLQIVLARLLDPEHYGTLALMVIFTNLANVFIQTGFSTSLVQNKEVTDDDYSSVFWVSLGVAIIIYIGLFLFAPIIAVLYEMPEIVAPFRVILLMLLPGAMQSVQLAKASREMDFKQIFKSNVIAIVFSGIAGVGLALVGAGLWALVAQTMLNVLISSIVMLFTVRWRPRLVCNLKRVKVLFAFGWKLLVSSLLDTLYQDISSLVVGKKYNASTLGVYNRGQQFPQLLANVINSAMHSVMLPAMASKQDDKKQIKVFLRNSITISAYIIFPMMAGLAGVATPLISILLTDKWLPCVPFLRIFCFSFAFYPVHTCNLQAINAMGRSDIFLKLEIIKKSYGLVFLFISVFCFDSPLAIAMTGIFTTIISCFVNAFPNKKLIGYSYLEQMKDIFPSFVAAIAMCGGVVLLEKLGLSPFLMIGVQIIAGVVIYMGISVMFKLKPFIILMEMIKEILRNKTMKGEA